MSKSQPGEPVSWEKDRILIPRPPILDTIILPISKDGEPGRTMCSNAAFLDEHDAKILAEGSISDGEVLQQKGSTDNWIKLAQCFLSAHERVRPMPYSPVTVNDVAVGLSLLLNAGEIGLKCHIYRSRIQVGTDLDSVLPLDKHVVGHELSKLFRQLEKVNPQVSGEISRQLKQAGCNQPIETLLAYYGQARWACYYRHEPTLKPGLIARSWPYPVYLPEFVRAVLWAYNALSPYRLLRQEGVDIAYPWSNDDQHGHYGADLASIGIATLRYPQEDMETCDAQVRSCCDPILRLRHGYGGKTFYLVRKPVPDVLKSSVCPGRIGFHSHDITALHRVLSAWYDPLLPPGQRLQPYRRSVDKSSAQDSPSE